MPVEGQEMHVAGVSIFGPPPLGWSHVSFQPGVTALYGKNGAGKTRLLAAISAALRGEAGLDAWGLVHVIVPGPGDFWAGAWRSQFDAALASHLTSTRGAQFGRLVSFRDARYHDSDADFEEAVADLQAFASSVVEEDFSPSSVSEIVAAQLRQLVSASNWNPEFSAADATIAEVADGGHFTLLATGTPAEPGWTIYAAGLPSWPDAAATIEQDRRFYDLMREAVQAQDDPERVARVVERVSSGRTAPSMYPWEEVGPFGAAIIAGTGIWRDGSTFSEQADHSWQVWPDWAGVPMVELGHINQLPVMVIPETVEQTAADETTRRHLAASCAPLLELATSDEAVFTEQFTAAVADLNVRASQTMSLVLQENAELRFDAASPARWFLGEFASWQMLDVPSGQWVPLAGLSAAQQRWASVAVALAVAGQQRDSNPLIFLFDEPEHGLHRGLEDRLPQALLGLARTSGVAIVAATHSPAMLNQPQISRMHVNRVRGHATAEHLPLEVTLRLDRDLAALSLGLSPAALLQTVRVFVLVEGQHDKAILDVLLLDDLRQASAVTVPMGGGLAAASIADSELLFEFTDAQIVIVLDNVAMAELMPLWEQATAHAEAGDLRRARRAAAELERLDGWEAKWMRDLLGRGLDRGVWRRIVPATLGEPDVICYLPVHGFIDGASWTDLKQEWRQHYAPRRPKDFKGWLEQRNPHGVKIGLKSIQAVLPDAVASRDLQDVGLRIQEAAGIFSSPEQKHGAG